MACSLAFTLSRPPTASVEAASVKQDRARAHAGRVGTNVLSANASAGRAPESMAPSHGLAGGVTEPCPAHHVDHFLPAELHRDHRIVSFLAGMPGFSGYRRALPWTAR